MPSVSTSIRVAALTRLSKRIRYPTVLPTGSPSSAAIRSAICRAASRLGSRIRILEPFSTYPSRMVSGSTVDLPAPGGAVTTRHAASASRRFTASAISSTGSSGSFLIAHKDSEKTRVPPPLSIQATSSIQAIPSTLSIMSSLSIPSTLSPTSFPSTPSIPTTLSTSSILSSPSTSSTPSSLSTTSILSLSSLQSNQSTPV